jgi:hypothetical protein
MTAIQRRLATLLAYTRSEYLERLGIAIKNVDVFRALGIEARPIRLPRPNIDFAAWTREDDDQLLRGYGKKTGGSVVGLIGGATILGVAIDEDIAELGHLFDGTGIVAMAGDDALVDWIASGNACDSVRVLGLVSPDRSVAPIAAMPFLAHVHRLVVDSAEGVDAVLASPYASALDVLSWRWALADEIPAAAQLDALRELRIIVNFEERPATMERLSAMFAAWRSPLEHLALHAMDVPLDAIAGNDNAVGVQFLDVEKSLLRGSELLAAFDRMTTLNAPDSSFDDVAASSLARCASLEAANLAGTAITDAGARALADGALGRLRVLDLRRTAVRDLDVVERLVSSLPSLEYFHVPDRVAIDLAIAGKQPRCVDVPAGDQLGTIERPKPPRDRFDARRALSAPPAGFTRRFVLDTFEHCRACNGSGWTSEGHCPWHTEAREIHHDGPVPPNDDLARVVAATASSIERAEHLAATIAPRVAHLGGRPHQIVWHFNPGERPRSFIDRLAHGVPLAATVYWPHACLHAGAGDRELFAAAAEIVDLGFTVDKIDGEAIHLGMRT